MSVVFKGLVVGFVPSRDPAVAIIVVTDAPHVYPNTGGYVSAPVFRRIAEATMQYLGIPPSINPSPPVLVARQDAADAADQPAEAPPPVVSLVTDEQPGAVPDLIGLSARDAIRRIVKLGMVPHLAGDGIVISQEPEPGTPIEAGAACRLVLKRSTKPVVEVAGQP
jgi:cell division protein FtsI (penicillin-binding protein 3)